MNGNNKIRNYISDINNVKIYDTYTLCKNNNINCKSCINKSYCCRIYKTIWTINLPCCLEITDELKRKNHIIYEIKKPKLKYKFRFSQ